MSHQYYLLDDLQHFKRDVDQGARVRAPDSVTTLVGSTVKSPEYRLVLPGFERGPPLY